MKLKERTSMGHCDGGASEGNRAVSIAESRTLRRLCCKTASGKT